jgi:hypothetical protein
MAAIERIDGNEFGRVYKITDDNEQVHWLPSVTTVLSMNKDLELDRIRNEIGHVKFDQLRDRATRRGNVMHKLLEYFLQLIKDNGQVNMQDLLFKAQHMMLADPEFDGWYTKYKAELICGKDLFLNLYHTKFWKDIFTVEHNEVFLWTLYHGGWGGTCDFVYRNHIGELVLVDFKSASMIKDIDKIHNYRMQVSVYMAMFFERYGEMPVRGEIWISNEKDTNIQKIIMYKDEIKNNIRDFVKYRRLFNEKPEWQKFIKDI